MSISITATFNGDPIDLDHPEAFLDKVRFNAAKHLVEQRVGTVTCPEHGEPPDITIEFTSVPEKFDVKVSSCCDAFMQEVKDRIQS